MNLINYRGIVVRPAGTSPLWKTENMMWRCSCCGTTFESNLWISESLSKGWEGTLPFKAKVGCVHCGEAWIIELMAMWRTTNLSADRMDVVHVVWDERVSAGGVSRLAILGVV